ncbi:hypothetical protein ACH0CV_15590 [Brachybacterium paraconglomeratum]|uniref:hypothetical protein n=1 Tax=Brachybacterium TaxID=43668 RepID=UPI0038791D2A
MSDNDKPRLTQQFITALERLDVTANGWTHEGSMPDVVIPLTALDSEILAEMRGMTVKSAGRTTATKRAEYQPQTDSAIDPFATLYGLTR